MGAEFEYRFVIGFSTFWLLTLFIGSLFGMAEVETQNVEDVNILTGAKAFFQQSPTSEPIIKTLYTIFIITPITLLSSMILLNYIRNRG